LALFNEDLNEISGMTNVYLLGQFQIFWTGMLYVKGSQK